jgi:diaminohydroxyphosphoribosylaminopyrimidine deaminase/5-amino-6-(5-phosphoribosylamino)uracil reductase
VVLLPNAGGKVELADLMGELARRALNEIHVEAGFKLNGSLVAAGVVDELLVYLAPSLIGESGQGMFNLPAIDDLAQRRRLVWRDVQRVGADLRLVARLA